MPWHNTPQRYGSVPLVLHWVTVLLVLLAWTLGQIGDALPRAMESPALFIHMSAGLLVLALLCARLAWRFADGVPPHEPTPFGRLGNWAADLGHVGLYALLLAVPLAGIALQFARGRGVPLFGLGEVASPWPADRAFSRSVRGVHETLANVLMILALLHAVAALLHHFVLRDRTLRRMLPGDVPE